MKPYTSNQLVSQPTNAIQPVLSGERVVRILKKVKHIIKVNHLHKRRPKHLTLKKWVEKHTYYTTEYQWYCNGVAIEGATGEWYVMTMEDQGKKISLKTTVKKHIWT